jgi:MFS transporter, DHA1 family, staphyloferrin A biosynthesis exporter
MSKQTNDSRTPARNWNETANPDGLPTAGTMPPPALNSLDRPLAPQAEHPARPVAPKETAPLGARDVLRFRNYRLLWTGNLISNTGDWMDQVSFNWLVYSMTDSALWLAMVNACRFIPILVFTLIGGVVADRIERRRMLFFTQACAMVLAVLLAVLVATGTVQIWMVMFIAFGRGVMNSFNQPAKQSLISDLVPTEALRPAIALNAVQLNLTKVIGPAIGGVLIASVGVAGAFYLNGLSFLAVLWSLASMRFPPLVARPRTGSFRTELTEGVQYLRRTPTLGMLVLLALIPVILGNPYQTMLTVFSRDVLKVGGSGFGFLTACSSVGSVVGALAVGMGQPIRRGRLMLVGLVGFGGALVVFAASHWLWLSAGSLFVVGVGQQVYLTLNNSVVQETVEPEYRGRVLSMLFLNRGMVPLGTMLAGLGTAVIGPQWAVGSMAAALLLLTLGVSRLAPAVRRLA